MIKLHVLKEDIIKCLLFCLKTPFNRISYTLIGDDTGPSFFELDNRTGSVKVKPQVDLAADKDTQYTVRIMGIWF